MSSPERVRSIHRPLIIRVDNAAVSDKDESALRSIRKAADSAGHSDLLAPSGDIGVGLMIQGEG